MAATVQKVLEELNELSLADRQYVNQVEERRLIDARRQEIARAGEEAIADYEAGKLKAYDSVEEMRRDLDKNYSGPSV